MVATRSRPETLTNGEDVEPAAIRRIRQTRSLMAPLVLWNRGETTAQTLTSIMHTRNKANASHHMSKARLKFYFAKLRNAHRMTAVFACAKPNTDSIPLRQTHWVRNSHLQNHLHPRTRPASSPRKRSSSGRSWRPGLEGVELNGLTQGGKDSQALTYIMHT